MKTLNFELSYDMLAEFVLSNEEMFKVRGGGEPEYLPTPPPVKI
jgi:hypothetical protein